MNEQELRQVFETQIREHILGPGLAKEIICCKEDASDEILDGDPKELYTTGVLYPTLIPSDNNDDGSIDDELEDDEATGDQPVVLDDDDEDSDSGKEDESDTDSAKESQIPDDRDRTACSDHIGLITCIEPKCEKVTISINYAKYRRLSKDEIPQVKVKLGYHYDKIKELFAKYDAVDGNDKAESYISIDDDNRTISLKRGDYKPDYPKIEGDLVEVNYLFKKIFSPSFYQREEKTYTCTLEIKDNVIEQEDFAIVCKSYCRNNKNGNTKKYLKILVRNKKKYKGQYIQKAPTESCLFQLCMRITPVNHPLVTYTDPVNYAFDTENNETEYLYRNIVNFGKGVGCAVNWNTSGEWIETAYIPHSEVKKFSNSLDEDYCDSLGLDEQEINEACKLINLSHWQKDDPNYISRLEKFVTGYAIWVNKQNVDAVKEPQFEPIYKDILKWQKVLLQRLQDNIEYLKTNPIALDCFQLANTAMLIQMTIARNSHFAKNRDIDTINEGVDILNNLDWFRENEENVKEPASYRPFQLAFLLMNVRSTFEEDDEYRKDFVDLIWFPTGGGKTEAYLALTALTIIARRKTVQSDAEANGVSVIMRYTLRLLTTQQFERASYLICALEFMRNQKTIDLGYGGRITIGRWIGQEKGKKREKYIKGLQKGEKDKTNPYPVTYCPWCGGKLVRDIKLNGVYNHGYINDGKTQCQNKNCLFHNAYLPIQYVDNELYKNSPTLLLATVDKFANLTKQDAAKMLGIGTDVKSPDLIIQDELHLISGPLGSMVGFFEMIVELMASKGGHRPKVIASTATTRNTGDQIYKLYNRDVIVFPAQGITYNDNFFSHVEDKSMRRHIGICPQAFPVKAEIRIIAQLILAKIALLKTYLKEIGVDITDTSEVSKALQQNGQMIKEIDPYWTLVLYYNSLKDLGRTRSRVSQEIFENLRTQKRYMQFPSAFDFVWSGIDKRVQEFTSRMDSSQIKDMLTRAESQAKLIENKETHLLHENESNLDLVLASNMISVGIDVARWNVMLMSGQPRSNSEYIQSSSRVARNHMGLVVNIYSPQRIRECSMFENFTSYHEAYYKYVEPLSLTPVTIQILKNNILNNIRKCYQTYICSMSDKDSVLRSLIDEMQKRFDLDKELAEYAKEELRARWNSNDNNDFVTSLRDVDPNCYTRIEELKY